MELFQKRPTLSAASVLSTVCVLKTEAGVEHAQHTIGVRARCEREATDRTMGAAPPPVARSIFAEVRK